MTLKEIEEVVRKWRDDASRDHKLAMRTCDPQWIIESVGRIEAYERVLELLEVVNEQR